MPTPVTDDGDAMQVTGTFPGVGAAPLSSKIVVGFADNDEVTRIEFSTERSSPPRQATELSPELRSVINNALANGTPMIVGYVDDEGRPRLSPRGSVQCLTGTQLCIWARPTSKGLTASLPYRPAMSLLYRDSRTRTTLTISGTGRIVTDEDTREAVFWLSPEVEQNHDPSREGTAVVIDIDEVTGSSPAGPVLVRPSR
ncbi:MAG: hypothetical protein GEV03_03050 [Streptosporangiales bacterium]|nr:hypothetical protein [Streptosporangiales bacterium]